jgi:hypothetical protein
MAAVAKTRNSYFRSIIYNAMNKLTNLNIAGKQIEILYYLDETKMPFIYIAVENENINQNIDTESVGDMFQLNMQNSIDYIIRLFFYVESDKKIAENINDICDNFIEKIEYEIYNIEPDYYIQQMKGENYYRVDIDNIKIDKNERSDLINNSNACVLTFEGKINYSITYL